MNISFKIFRKLTTTDTLIHGSSYHTPSYKHVALLAMVHRLWSVPLASHDFQVEINTRQYLARINYISMDVDNLIQKIQTTRALDRTTYTFSSQLFHKMGTTPLIGEFAFKLARTLEQFNMKPAFYHLWAHSKIIFQNIKTPYPSTRGVESA